MKADLSKYTAAEGTKAGKSINIKNLFEGIAGIKSYKVDPADIATIKKNGKLTIKKSGHIKITAMDKDGKVLAEKDLDVVKPELKSKTLEINRGGRFDMNTLMESTVKPDEWTAKGKAGTINNEGLLTINANGKVTVTAVFGDKASGMTKLICKVTVKMPAFSKKAYKLKAGATLETKLKNLPEGASATYRSDNTSVVTVDEKGTLKGVSAGSAVVSAFVNDIAYTVPVTVK